MNALPYIHLPAAARRLDMTPDALRALCEGPNINAHGFKYGDTYVVSAESVEKLENLRRGLCSSQ